MKTQYLLKIIAMFLLSGLLTFAFGEETNTEKSTPNNSDDGYIPAKSIFDNKKTHLSGFGGPTVRFGGVNGDFAVFTGGKGGVIINDSLIIGGGGSGMAHPRSNGGGSIGYGGFLVEYLFLPKSVINFSVGTIIGAGGGSDSSIAGYNSQAFFVLEPEINLFLNITPFFKIGLTGTYRYTSGLNGTYINDKSFRGFSGGLIMVFGKF